MTIDSTDSPAPMGGAIIPFGKHKGRLIEELILDDPGYLEWLSAQDWFRTKFTILHQTIINRGSEPEETPDHNAMQVRFLDDAFCLRFMHCCLSGTDQFARARLQDILTRMSESTEQALAKKRRDAESEQRSVDYWNKEDDQKCVRDHKIKLHRIQAEIVQIEEELARRHTELGDITYKFTRTFEERGADVVLRIWAESKQCVIEHELSEAYPQDNRGAYYHYGLAIELKPTIGDDYPAVLRQMKRNGSNVLFVGEYTGKGATEEQFIKTFATASKRVVFARELEG
jgi:uncharacterized protein (DUF3820 family)